MNEPEGTQGAGGRGERAVREIGEPVTGMYHYSRRIPELQKIQFVCLLSASETRCSLGVGELNALYREVFRNEIAHPSLDSRQLGGGNAADSAADRNFDAAVDARTQRVLNGEACMRIHLCGCLRKEKGHGIPVDPPSVRIGDGQEPYRAVDGERI